MPEILNQDGTPAVLSPEDQAEVLRLAAEEPPTLTDPFKPLTYESPDGVEPTSAQKREIRKAANLVDPMLDLTPDEMVEFARNDPDKRFNILAAFQERQEEISKDPDAVDNIAQAWTKYKESTSLADLELGKIPENIWGFVKGAAKQVGTILWNYPKRILTEAGSPANLEATRNLGEAAAASEAGLQGLAHMVEAKLKFGPPERAKAPDWQNPEAAPRIRPATENPVVSLFGDVEKAKQLREIIEGAGPLSSPETVAKLKEAGFPIRPEEVEKMAAGDILSLHLFGKAFGAISHLTPGLTQAALKTAGKGTAIGVGKTIERTAKAAEWVIPKVAAAAPAAGAVKGALLGGSAGSPMAGAAAGLAVGKSFAKTLRGAMPKLADIESAGRQIAGTGGALPKGNLAQLIKDVAEAAPATAYEGGKGLFMDVVLAEGAETPEEVKGVGLGLAFGLVGGAGRMGGHVLSGQLIAPREWGKGIVVPSNKYFPGLDALHNEAITTAPDGVSARVNAVRAFVRAAVPNADFIFAGPKPKTGPDPLVAQLEKLGLSTEQATQWANTEGLFSKEINGHRLIVARDVAAAPHESFHALQDVLGESANRQLDAVIQGDPKYAQFWDAYGKNYAMRLEWNPESGQTWQEYILDKSKWGMAEAAEITARDTIQTVDPATGEKLPVQGPVTEQTVADALAYAKDNWRTILTPEQQAEVANRYVAREIGAENFDALFKRGIANDKTFTTKAVQLLGEMVRAMGGDPLAGRASEVSGYPLSADVVKAAGQQATAATAGKLPPEIAPGRTLPRGGMPTTPEQREDAAKEAQAHADASADARLGVLSKAIATGQVVVLNKLSAPDAPASDVFANRRVRRAQQEAGRSMPEDQKSLWFKAFVPERILAISGGKYQVLGWAPEVFAANVQRTVRSIAEMMLADPTASRLSPYPIDPATKSLTPEGWRSLYADTQQQVQNYMAGRTGSGEPLVVPKFTAEKGIYAPSLQPGAPLEQPKSDFISAMFGFKLPETPRITKGKLPLNIAGQEVSAATIPGRIREPLNRREPFSGEAAEKLGIQGREILEVNPWRVALELSADALKVKMPELIETIQKINLDSIKDVQAAPEQPNFRGNTLTLSAGFQPKRAGEERPLFTTDKELGFFPIGYRDEPSIPRLNTAAARNLQTTGGVKLVYHGEPAARNLFAFGPKGEDMGSAFSRRVGPNKTEIYTVRASTPELEATLRNELAAQNKIDNTPIVTERPAQFMHSLEGIKKLNQDEIDRQRRGAESETSRLSSYAGSPDVGLVLHSAKLRSTGFITPEQSKQFLEDYKAAKGARAKSDLIETYFGAQSKGDATAAAQFQVTRPAEVVPDFRPEEIKGAEVHLPATSYHAAAQGESNPWIRRSADAARSAEMDNADRTLLVQISSDLINPESLAGSAKDEATQYYDKLYSGARPGYARMQDFWEIPQWIGNASKFLPNADVYVVRSVAQAREFLKTAGYKNVAFSALDTNKALIRDIVKDYPGKVDIGGYVDPKTFEDLPNTKWHGTMESLAKEMGVPYVEGVDYRHFQGSDVIPRLTMSKGCRHKCAFCSVEKAVEVTPADVVTQQADAIAELGTKLVYLNDKTFGQAANYKDLTAINKQILAKNPDFKGFVIQTTAAQLKVMSPEFLKESGIKFVELGVESYNDPILKEMHKPATESMINQVTDKLRQAGIALIPNIIIGHPSETAATYAKTLKFLQDNKDIISHANIYNLALYKDTELGKKVISISEGDFNENVLEKSFHTNPEIHRQFAGDAYGLAQSMLEGKPSAAQFAPSNDPRAIDKAALRDKKSGKVFTGSWHGDAAVGAIDEGYSSNIRNYDEGWVTRGGEFLNRQESYQRGVELGQIPKRQSEEGASGELESGGFDRTRQFQPNVKNISEMPKTREELFPAGLYSGQFLPNKDPRAIRTPAIRDPETKKVYEGVAHYDARSKALDAGVSDNDLYKFDDGYVTNTKDEFLDRTQAFARANELKQIPAKIADEAAASGLDRGLLSEDLKSKDTEVNSPIKEFTDKLLLTSTEEFNTWVSENKGLTQTAYDAGAKAEGTADLDMLRATSQHFSELSRNALAAKDYDAAGGYAYKGQAAREAFEYATGQNFNAQDVTYSIKMLRPAYEPHLAPKKVQFAAKKREDEAPVYYSQLSRVVNSKFSGTQMPAAQLEALLRNPQNEVKADEMKWSGMDDFLRGKQNVTKAEVLDFLIGKEAAEKLAAQTETHDPTYGPVVWLEGQDLKIGGEGMKFGARVEERQIPGEHDASGNQPPATVHSRPITPQMRESVMREGVAQFVGKKKEDWKFKAAVGGGGEYASSKAWITPEGEPVQLGGQLHHAYLYQNPEMLKKYGIKVSKGTEDIDIRDGAIKRGFARVDYKISSGALTVEARQKDWPVIAQSVRKLVQENVNKVDAMTVYLYNNDVSKIVDTQSASLFRFSNKEKMENLPLISAPSEVTSMSAQSSAQFAPFPDKSFDAEIEKIRTGKSGGQTFNPSGLVWEAPKSPSDLVSLASVNVPLGKLTREAVEAALAPYADLLDEPGVAAGMFAFSKDGKPTVSIDINAVIDQKHRKNTLDFAKQNDQVSIWDAMINSEVKSGGKGDTKLTTPGEILDALGGLQRGKKVDVPEILRQNRDVEAGFEQQELLGGKPYVSTANLTKAEIAAKFPEAVIPRNRKEPIQSDVLNSPLAKAAKTTEAAASAFARKMVEFAREYEAHPSFQSGLKWYSEFVPMLKKKFGKDAPVMAELLAGTSPQQAPTSNYAMALDALEGYKSGRFNKNITGFEKGLDKIKDGSWQKWLNREIASGDFANPPATPTENTFVDRWVEKHNLLPRQSNGALYAISSDAVLRILARRWLGNTAGLKTQNFVKNLLGVEHEATIDLWADRTMRRIGYAGSKERWRILPKNATGVTDADFLFAQEVFRRAAKEMNLTPDALQGGLWFAEKQLWADQGWGRLDLGDFRKEIKKTELLKSGIEQRLAAQKAAGKAKPVEQLSLDIVQPR